MHRPRFLRFVVLALASLAFVSTVTAKVTEKFEKTYALNADGSVSLGNVNGDVEIVAWDKNEVSLWAEKSARDEEELAHMKIVIEDSPAHFSVKTEYEKQRKSWRNNHGEVRYKLMVPAGATLKRVDVVNSDLTVRGVRGNVSLASVNGSIEADGLTAGGRFETVNGGIRVSFDKLSASDKIVVETTNGGGSLTLPENAAFELEADSVNGRVSCDFPIRIISSGRRHLTGTVNGGGARIVLDSVNGGLRVKAAK